MSLRIGNLQNVVVESSRSYLRPRNFILATFVGFIVYKILAKMIENWRDASDQARGIPNIRVLFRKPYENGMLNTMDEVFINADTNITFFGWRYITAPGYQGCISMDEAADRIQWLSDHQKNLAEQERQIGETFADKIFNLYRSGDELITNSNLFSGTLCAFRDCYCDPGGNSYGSDRWHAHSVFKRKTT